jgi:uroporphyrinogen III methyltransferase / synthase
MVERPGLGKVYIVGAGPGDPGLITRRGAELLARADVVAYDRLVDPELLELAPQAELVDVGKRPGQSAEGQARINEVLIDEARRGRVVVRLKGGDPFVFGRGGEEAELLAEAGIPFEIVPGVTSAVAGPAYAGIPLTHRDFASWVAIATGHEDPTKESSTLDWDALAKAPSAVFLMGIERLDVISQELQRAGKRADTPVAVVASATRPQQRILHSTLEKVADAVATAGITAPAVLVVGEITTLGQRLEWLSRRPLAGLRVFVTRTRAQAGKLSAMLRDAGAEPLEFPAIKIVEPSTYAPLDEALKRVGRYAWVLFTSTNTVEAVFRRLPPLDARAFADSGVAAIGPATADALRAHGIEPDLVPSKYTTEALAKQLGVAPNEGTAVLLPQADDAPRDLERALAANDWSVDVVPAYRTVPDADAVEAGREALKAGVDAVLFTSASTVENFVRNWGTPPPGTVVCCIGPRTAEAAQRAGIASAAESPESSIEALVNTLIEAVRR